MGIATTAPAAAQAFAGAAFPPPRFLIPSNVWYGLEPLLAGIHPAPGTPDLPVDGWGGRLTGDEDLSHALLTLDGVLLVLNLAGYQVPEVVVGIPSLSTETAAGDLAAVDMRSMEFARGTARPAPVPGTTPASAHISLWVEPRYPSFALSLAARVDAMAVESIDLAFADTATGWLRLRWDAHLVGADWPTELARLADVLADALIGELELQRAQALAAAGDAPALCGLLSLYDHRTWSVQFPAEAPFDPITAGIKLFADRLDQVVATAGFGAFLRSEILQTTDGPPSVIDRWPTVEDIDHFRAAIDDLTWLVDDLIDQCTDRAAAGDPIAATFVKRAYADLDLSVTGALLRWQEVGALDFLGPIETATGAELYGGWDLQRGDDDGTHRYGGAVRTERLPSGVEPGYVAQLRADLAELGFGPMFQYKRDEAVVQAWPAADPWLERAVRELQLYARMPNVAFEIAGGPFLFYGDALSSVPNPLPYGGPVSGVVNAETRAVISHWLAHRLRCPIVVEARRRDADDEFTLPWNGAGSDVDNLWRTDQVATQAPRMFGRDFTGHWALTAESVAAGRSLNGFVIGEWNKALQQGPWTNPPDHVWAETEVTAERLTGKTVAAMSADERSTFRIVRAVAEVECIGYFDCFNAYDAGFISAGPYHWTLGLNLGGNSTVNAELPPFLAYLKSRGGDAAAAYEAAFGSFGCAVEGDWPQHGSGAATPFWNGDHHKYEGWVSFEDDHGNAVEAPRLNHEGADWFRQWHWYCRFALNARTLEVMRRRMWDYARLRIRDVFSTPWEPAIQTADPAAPGGTRPATIGDIFTSERSVAVIIRWHVNRPGNLLPWANSSRLRVAFNNAGAAAWGDPATWKDDKEATLLEALYVQRPPDPPGKAVDSLRETLEDVHEWPASWGANLRHWRLELDPLRNYPRIAGIENGRTDKNTDYVDVFTVDMRDVRGTLQTPTAVSSDQSIVANAGITVVDNSPNYGLRIKPVANKTGTVTITVTADNGAESATKTFFLTVGGDVREDAPPAPPDPTLGLSVRRRSYLPYYVGLP
jgi:hypothetical protein